MGQRGEIFSTKTTLGKRTYFFNVKENRNGDLFLNLVESKKTDGENFERHSILVFNEDLEPFMENFEKAVKYLRTHVEQKKKH